MKNLRALALTGGNHNFESSTYYSEAWLFPHWVIAEGDGLFSHEEIGEAPHAEFF